MIAQAAQVLCSSIEVLAQPLLRPARLSGPTAALLGPTPAIVRLGALVGFFGYLRVRSERDRRQSSGVNRWVTT
jgi:hypothetical protein